MRRFAEGMPDPVDMLDIGDGQLAFLAVALWGDRGCLTDLDRPASLVFGDAASAPLSGTSPSRTRLLIGASTRSSSPT